MPVVHTKTQLKEVGHVIAQFYGGMCMYAGFYLVGGQGGSFPPQTIQLPPQTFQLPPWYLLNCTYTVLIPTFAYYCGVHVDCSTAIDTIFL